MRVVGLVSGGKDSCYNMVQCVRAGHEIVALANIQPDEGDELDSMMYQTVGHEGIFLYAEAMGLPLFTASTHGTTECSSMQYEVEENDEVEDLYRLLKRVKDEVGVDGVSVGAVLSDYQRIRVENVCGRLGLVSLAYLWRQNQAALLQEMSDMGVEAIVVKVAAAGLTRDHLGRTIRYMRPTLLELHHRYGVSVGGEGGEYETFTLDCPLFYKRIVLEHGEVVVHSDDLFAPVCYLKLHKLSLKDKTPTVLPPLATSFTSSSVDPICPDLSSIAIKLQAGINENKGVYWMTGEGKKEMTTATEQATDLLQRMTDKLTDPLSWQQAILVHLLLADMTNYAEVNSVYSPYITSSPPARVCVGMPLPDGVKVKIEVMSSTQKQQRSHMHVQSISHWAPANIGPYSQAYTLGSLVVVAGQIGLLPHSMCLVEEPHQAALSLTHVLSILLANRADWSSCLGGTCFCTTLHHISVAKQAWRKLLSDHQLGAGCPVAFVQASSLPRGAVVEWHFTAAKTPLNVKSRYSSTIAADCLVTTNHTVIEEDQGNEQEEEHDSQFTKGCSMVTIAPLHHAGDSVNLSSCLRTALSHLILPPSYSFLRVFIPKHSLSSALTFEATDEIAQSVFPMQVALSLITTEGYWDLATPLTAQLW